MEEKMLYVVFSATPLKIGSMIRTVTGEKYNHVSISFSPSLKTLYSYARYYKKAPLYGGFVKENAERYQNKGKTADVFVCAIPITCKQCQILKKQLVSMAENHEQYRYNILSAALAPMSKRVIVPGCFTCIEFVTSMLSQILPSVSAEKFYSIEDLRRILLKYAVYSGPFPNIDGRSFDEVYEKPMGFIKAVALSANLELWFIGAFLRRKSSKGKKL